MRCDSMRWRPAMPTSLALGARASFSSDSVAVWAAVIMRSACSATAAAEALEGAVAVRVLSTVYCFCTSSSWRLKSAGQAPAVEPLAKVGSAGLCLLAHLGQHIQRRQGASPASAAGRIGLGHALRQRRGNEPDTLMAAESAICACAVAAQVGRDHPAQPPHHCTMLQRWWEQGNDGLITTGHGSSAFYAIRVKV